MNGETKETLAIQTKAFVVFHFLHGFNSIEKLVNEIFSLSISSFSEMNKRRLHYYYGSRIATFNDQDLDWVKLKELKFDTGEKFADFKPLQVLKIDRQFKMITDFSFEIDSLQSARQVYDFRSCMVKIIKMRNKLAHELVDCKFSTQDIIETLSNDNMKKYGGAYLIGNSATVLDQMTRDILGNLVYMKIMIERLNDILESKKKELEEEHGSV